MMRSYSRRKVDAFTVRFETHRLQGARCIRYGDGFDVGPIAKVVIDGDRLLGRAKVQGSKAGQMWPSGRGGVQWT